jgi:hypothetical protein
MMHNRRDARMDWLRKHRPTRFLLQRLSTISGSNDIACMSKIYTKYPVTLNHVCMGKLATSSQSISTRGRRSQAHFHLCYDLKNSSA